MTKLICRINNLISIWADNNQYIVRIKTTESQNIKHASNAYFSNLEMCFEEVFDYVCRNRLADGKDKNMEKIAEIILEAKKEIQNTLQPFVRLNEELKGRQDSEEGGKTPLKVN